ncbi:hemolytic protein HlpA-like protein [Opitutaceae bacterium EW11]|nr:hemolytic protein HlpA-like protein [Opitutaceae bacterium EW11]
MRTPVQSPIVYIFFNRPELIRRTFSAIRAEQPRQLYLVADGPRATKPDDPKRCAEARAVVESLIDWPCEVTKDYSEVNLGSGKRIASGLERALEKLGEAIVIEDDILPRPDFFRFCSDMLERYRDVPEVHGISGYNPIGQYLPGEYGAVPALTHITWGWATWNRAWKAYRFNLEGWDAPSTKDGIRDYVRDPLYFHELTRAFRVVQERKVDAWDYQWVYTMLYERRHAVVSSVNLVENLGFMADATHTFEQPAFVHGLRTYAYDNSRLPDISAAPDRLFDRVHWQVYLDGSRLKIALLRQLAKRSRSLTAKLLGFHP